MKIKNTLLFGLILVAAASLPASLGQLPDDIQRELNQNLAEQARLQALRHQQQLAQSRSAAGQPGAAQQPQQQPAAQPQDPNNYSYQQVSPPVQYSYYQPFGDAAAQTPPGAPVAAQPAAQARISPETFDLNNLNLELPQPQAQVASPPPAAAVAVQQPQPHLTPSFTGAGGLPVMQPMAAAQVAAQPRVQQGPPLTEADFKDITGGENYGAPGGQDFGLGEASSAGSTPNRRQDSTDAQLREFGFPSGGVAMGQQQQQQPQFQQQFQQPQQQQQLPAGNMADFGLDEAPPRAARRQQPVDEFGLGLGGSSGLGGAPAGSQRPPTDFDFAVQPSASQQPAGAAAAGVGGGGGAPGSLETLLGAGFPGLGTQMGGAEEPARGSSQQRTGDDAGLELADMGDRADQFSGADLGQFTRDQPRQPQQPPRDQDFQFAAAASNQQPASVPYPDGGPQPVGTLWALTQPQSLTQTRYSALPDKGTFQDYPAYRLGASPAAWGVRQVVDGTPRARSAGAGRYGQPASSALAPELRARGPFDYARGPLGLGGYE